jgi:hypothetical protein
VAAKYVKWVRNADPTNDWTTERKLADGEHVVRMGQPIQLGADLVKELEGKGLVFEDSSKQEYDEYMARPDVRQPVGGDVAATAPVFITNEEGINQAVETPGDGDTGNN